MGLVTLNLTRAAHLMLSGKSHVLAVGDSQTVAIPHRLWAVWPRISPTRYHYVVMDSSNTSALVPSNTLGYGGTTNNYGGVRTDTSYGALTTGPNGILRPARTSTYASNTGDGSLLGTGTQINRRVQSGLDPNANGNFGYPWPDLSSAAVAGVARPWYHGTHLKCKSLWYNCPSMLSSFTHSFNRAGKSATDITTSNSATPLTGTTLLESTWTNTRTDDNDYDVATGGTGVLNDHDIQYRLYGTTGVDETGLNLIPQGVIVARCDAGGTIPWNSDGTGASFDAIGRSGAYVADWLNSYATQTVWQEYFTRTVLASAAKTVCPIMLGHNMDGASDYTGSTVNDVFRTNYQSFVQMLAAAHLAAFPSGEFVPLIIVPWRSGESSAFDTLARCQSAQAQIERMCSENGWPMVSLFEYFGQVAPFHMLHPSTAAEGEKVALALRDLLDRATRFAYSVRGSAGASGRSSRMVRR